MDKLALLSSLAALLLATFAFVGAGDEPGAPMTAGGTDLDARVGALEAELAALKRLEDPLRADAAQTTSPRPGGLEGRPAAVPDRIARLEAELATVRERVDDVETRAAENAKAGHGKAVLGPTWFTSVDAAAKHLRLEDGQKADFERVVGSTKDRLQELYATPNDDGMTWKEASRLEVKGDRSGSSLIMFGELEKLKKFKQTLVPGTNETYADAEARILKQGGAEARELLTPAQRETWDGAKTDPLFRHFKSTISVAVAR